MDFKLTNDTARQDFISAYALAWDAPAEHAEKLLDELLDQRAYREAERLRNADPSLGDVDTLYRAADYIDPTIPED